MTAHKPKLPLPERAITLPAQHFLRKLPPICAIIGLVFLLATLGMGFLTNLSIPVYGAYLVAYLFFLSIALGGLFFVLLHFAVRAGWSVVVRRLAEYTMATIPLFVILALPLLLGGEHSGLHAIYHHWLDPKAAADPIIKGKIPYLNLGFFLIRALIYFAVWILISQWYLRNSIKQDSVGGIEISKKLQFWSPVSLAAFAITTSFAAFDWIMSIEPHWFSTIFGIYFFSGCAIAIYATLVLMVISLRKLGFLNDIVTVEHDHDLGKLLFGFIVFWSYIAFSQFMLLWYANMPEGTLWYTYRIKGEWLNLTILLAIGHFVLPFFFMMSRKIKRNIVTLAISAIWILIFHLIDLYWLIMPSLYHGSKTFSFQILDLLFLVSSFIGIGGIFVAGVIWWMPRTNLVPIKDPRLPESLSFENM